MDDGRFSAHRGTEKAGVLTVERYLYESLITGNAEAPEVCLPLYFLKKKNNIRRERICVNLLGKENSYKRLMVEGLAGKL